MCLAVRADWTTVAVEEARESPKRSELSFISVVGAALIGDTMKGSRKGLTFGDGD